MSTSFDNRLGAVGRYELTKRAHRSALLAFRTQSSARYEFFSCPRECRPSALHRTAYRRKHAVLHARGMIEERPMEWSICKRHFAISGTARSLHFAARLVNQMKAANEKHDPCIGPGSRSFGSTCRYVEVRQFVSRSPVSSGAEAAQGQENR